MCQRIQDECLNYLHWSTFIYRWLAEQYMSTLILDGSQMKMSCAFGDQEFLLSQTYVIVLLALALFVNSRNRNIKRNYKVLKT